jgi:hypothetical protein
MATIAMRLRSFEVQLPVGRDGGVLFGRENDEVTGIEAVLDGTEVMDMLADREFNSLKFLENESMRLPVFTSRLEAAVALLEATADPEPA